MIKIPIRAISVAWTGEHFLTLVRRGKGLSMLTVSENGEVNYLDNVYFEASRGFVLHVELDSDAVYLSIDSYLVLIKGNKTRTIIKLSKKGNFFWSAVKAFDTLFVSEYGRSPTSIYSIKGDRSKRLVTNKQIDITSKHFHQLAYDSRRERLLVTLGDGNLVRVALSNNYGENWEPMYRGVWQFVPIVPLNDRIVLGMDSEIARGGIGIFKPDIMKWEFIFLKWFGDVKRIEFTDLRFLGELWLAGLGIPQAFIISRDLKIWYLLFLKGLNNQYDYQMKACLGKYTIALPLGDSLVLFKIEEIIRKSLDLFTIITPRKAYGSKLKGFLSSFRRRFRGKFRFLCGYNQERLNC